MKSENYSNMSDEFAGDITHYEEQLLLNYDDYLEGTFETRLKAINHFDLTLSELEDDMHSEYDENDWEELESDYNAEEEYEKNKKEPGTFLMKS